MTKSSAYWMRLGVLAFLASLIGGMSVGAALGAPKVAAPSPPRVTVRLPTLLSPQQQSLWGINQNLQRDRDRWQRQQQKTPKNTGMAKYLEY